MAITLAERKAIIEVTVAMFGAAPGGYMDDLVNMYEAAGKNLTQFAKDLAHTPVFQDTARYPNYLAVEEIAAKMTQAYGLDPNDDADADDGDNTPGADAYNFFLAQLNGATGDIYDTIGELFVQANDYLNNVAAADPNNPFHATALALSNKVTVAEYYTITMAATSTDLGVLSAAVADVDATTDVSDPAAVINSNLAAVIGQTFTLTTGEDNIVGTAGNDTIRALIIDGTGARATTLSAFDAIDGGAGTDTLNIYSDGTHNKSLPTSATVSNVEIINIYNDTTAFSTDGTGNIDASKFAGATNINQVGLASATMTNLAATTTATFTEVVTDAALDVTAAATAASVNVALDEVADGDLSDGNEITLKVAGDALTTVNVTGTIAAGTDESATQALNINVKGGVDVKTVTLNTAIDATVTVDENADVNAINAAASTGSITFAGDTDVASITTGAGEDDIDLNYAAIAGAKAATVSTGDGDDTLSILVDANGLTGVTVTADAGAGDDVVDIDTTGAVAVDFTAGAGNDRVVLGDALTAGATVDGGDGEDTIAVVSANVGTDHSDVISNFEVLEVTDALAHDLDVANFDDIQNVVLAAGSGAFAISGINSNATVTYGADNTGKSTLTGTADVINIVLNADDSADFDEIEAANVETVNLESTTTAADPTTVTNTVGLTIAAAETLNVTGDAKLEIDTALTSVETVAAADFDAGLTVNLTGNANDATVTVGDGDNDVIGGDGADTITVGDGNDAIDGGTGDDTIVAGNGSNDIIGGAGADTITVGDGDNTIDGGAGDDTIVAGNGSNDIIGGAGADTITVGDGDNTIDSGADDDIITAGAGDDTIDGGDGNDTIVAGNGANNITGGAGADSLAGGEGNDTFRYYAQNESAMDMGSSFAGDTIVGFNAGDGTAAGVVDRIQLPYGWTATTISTVTVGSANLATFSDDMKASGNLTTALAQTGGVAVVTVSNGTAAGTYIMTNNGTAGGYSSDNTLVVKLDSATNLDKLSVNNFAKTNALTPDVATAMAHAAYAEADTVIVTDSGSNIAAADFATLQAKRVDFLDATDNVVSLTTTQADNVRNAGLKFAANDALTVTGQGSALAALEHSDYSTVALGGASVTLDASDDAATLTVTQADSVRTNATKLADDDALTVTGEGDDLAALDHANYATGALGGASVTLDASDDAATLTVTQADSVRTNATKFDSIDTLTVTATGSELAVLTYSDYATGALGGASVTLDASDNAVSLTKTQADNARNEGLKFDSSDALTVTDTGSALAGLTYSDYTTVALGGVSVILDASDNAVSLTKTQADNARNEGLKFAANDTLNVTGQGSALAALTYSDYATGALGGASVTLDASDNAVSLTRTQADNARNAGLKFDSSDALTVTGTKGSALAGLTHSNYSTVALGGASVTLDASDDAATLTVDQADSVRTNATKFAADDALTVTGEGADLAALDHSNYATGALGGASVTLDASDDAATLTITQADSVRTNGTKFADDDALTVTGEGDDLAALDHSDYSTVALGGASVTLDASDNAAELTVDQANSVRTNGTKFAAGDALTVTGEGDNLAALDHSLYATVALGGASVTLDASDNAAELTVDQANSVRTNGTTFAADDALTVTGDGDDLAALNHRDYSTVALGGASVTLDASDDAATLTVDQADSVRTNATKFAADDALTVTGDGDDLAALDHSDYSTVALGGASVTLDASDNAAELTVDQADSVRTNGTKFAADDDLTVTGDGDDLAALDHSLYATVALGGASVTLDASDNAAELTVDQANSVRTNGTTFAADDDLTVTGAGNDLAALDHSLYATDELGGDSVTLDASDNKATLTVDQADSVRTNGTTFAADDDLTVTGAGNDLAALNHSLYATDELGGDSVTLDASDNKATLTVDQANSVRTNETTFAADDALTLDGEGDDLAALNHSLYATDELGGASVTLDASDNKATLSVTQANSVRTNETTFAADDALTVTGQGSALAALEHSDYSTVALGGASVTLDASDNKATLTITQADSLRTNAIKFDSSDTLTLDSAGNYGDISAIGGNTILNLGSTDSNNAVQVILGTSGVTTVNLNGTGNHDVTANAATAETFVVDGTQDGGLFLRGLTTGDKLNLDAQITANSSDDVLNGVAVESAAYVDAAGEWHFANGILTYAADNEQDGQYVAYTIALAGVTSIIADGANGFTVV